VPARPWAGHGRYADGTHTLSFGDGVIGSTASTSDTDLRKLGWAFSR